MSQRICEHNKRWCYCRECGGTQICRHDKRRNRCKECGGNELCEHDRVVSMCRSCNGFKLVARQMYAGAKSRAKRDGLPFDITSKEIFELIGEGVCPVFGTPYNIIGRLTNTSATLDRFIPSLGYIRSNCVVISSRANSIKSNATTEEIQRVADWMKEFVRINRTKVPKAESTTPTHGESNE